MSHLGTLVERAKRFEPRGAQDDSLKRTVSNIAEYMVKWRDYTAAEEQEAKAFVQRYPEAVDRKNVGAIERDNAYQAEKVRLEKSVNPGK